MRRSARGQRGRKRAALALVTSLLGACSPGEPAGREAAEHLRASFPALAGRLLAGERAFVEEGGAFSLADPSDEPRPKRALALHLPRRAEEPIVISTGALDVRVRELGSEGEGSLVASAVLYPRSGGTSLWTGTAGGFEEWLVLEPGAARGDRAAAAWEIEGAEVRRAGEIVEIADGAGIPRIRVSAPAAYAKSGRAVPVRLEVEGARIALVVDGEGEEVLVDPSWTLTGVMIQKAREGHTATRLPSGKVLVAGGGLGNAVFATAELYDPATSTWSPAAAMAHARVGHRATLLPDGKVLVTGGAGNSPAGAELYDPATNTWSPAAPMGQARHYHVATLLPSGKVLVAAGIGSGVFLTSAELYDPGIDTWSPAASMIAARSVPSGTLLLNGKVLVAGGGQLPPIASAELYDPATDAWSPTPPMPIAHGAFHTALLLPSGQVLVAGGQYTSDMAVDLGAEADLYDPASNAWSPAASMDIGRGWHTATLLPNGTVLVAGGRRGYPYGPTATAELYDPAGDTWSPTVPMNEVRSLHTATLLPNGKVLVAGSNGDVGAELYSFGSPGDPCSSPADCTDGLCADGVCCDTPCNAGACDACSVLAGADVSGTCKLLTGPACDDGSACTSPDICQAGVCTGAPVLCPASDECHTGACDPATGLCASPPKPDGSPCSLGSCQAGLCMPLPDGGAGSGGAGGMGGAGGSGGSAGAGAGATSTGSTTSTGTTSTGSTISTGTASGGSAVGASSSATSSGAGGAPFAGAADFPDLYGRAGCYCDTSGVGDVDLRPATGLLVLLLRLRRRRGPRQRSTGSCGLEVKQDDDASDRHLLEPPHARPDEEGAHRAEGEHVR